MKIKVEQQNVPTNEGYSELLKKKWWVVLKKQPHSALNLCYLYASWKETNPDKKVGFSTFAVQCSKCCVRAGASGTHAACVCKTVH